MKINHYSISGDRLSRDLRKRVALSVPSLADRDNIMTYQRRWYMVVAVYDDGENNGFYYLKKGKNSDTLGDNDNWERWEDHDRLHSITSEDDHETEIEHADKVAGWDAEGKPAAKDPYTHPSGFEDQPETPLSGSTVISQVEVNEHGHVTGVKVRDLFCTKLSI